LTSSKDNHPRISSMAGISTLREKGQVNPRI
jgi:hypothetical protein